LQRERDPMRQLNPNMVHAVLAILVEGTVGGKPGYTTGTAFLVPQGILTAYHTLKQAGNNIKIFVYHPDIGECRAELVAKDERKDLALLRLKAKRKWTEDRVQLLFSKHLRLPNQDFIEEDTPVFMIGCLPPKEPLVVEGFFRHDLDPRDEYISLTPITPDPDAARTSFTCTFSPPGFSGGPVLLTDGSVISVILTWHQFFGETRGTTLSQLREFLTNQS